MMKPQAAPRGLAVLLACLFAAGIQAQQVATVISTNLYEPNYITTDQGNIVYFTDSAHYRIMKFNVAETNVTVLAGSSTSPGTNNGTGTAARFYSPQGIVYDSARSGLVVVDQANQTLRFVTLNGVVTNLAGITPASPVNSSGGFVDGPLGLNQFSYPAGIATDNNGNLFIADQGNSAIRILNSANVLSTVHITSVLSNGVPLANYVLDHPAAVAFDSATSNLWVADTLHQTICLITNINTVTGNNTLFLVAGTPGVSGSADTQGASGALFDLPCGLLWDTNGLGLLISDTANNTIRELTGSLAAGFTVQTVAGSPPPALHGDQDGVPANALFWNPVGLAFDTHDGGYYVIDRGNNALRSMVLTPVTLSLIPPETEPVAPPTFSPNSGYFTNCVTVVVSAGVPDVYYTINGTQPTVNSLQVLNMSNNPLGGFEGSIQFCNSEQDLSVIQMIAINGTNFSTITTGQPPNTNLIGVPFGKLVGSGSTAIIQVAASLKTGVTLESLQFRVEVVPNGSAPPITTITPMPIGTNDFVPITGPVAGNLSPTYQTVDPYSNGPTNGLYLLWAKPTTTLGAGNPVFGVTGSATLALLEVAIPANSLPGQTYTVNVLDASGTSDGVDSAVPLELYPAQTLSVSNVQYLVGDTAPNSGYSAGEFGDGLLENNDVNNALFASVGIAVPYPGTDAFNAMDAYPLDTTTSVGGDGFIQMLDWETILWRSLGLITNNWVRFWTNSSSGDFLTNAQVGVTNGVPVPIGSPRVLVAKAATPPGQVWVPNATFSAGSVSGLTPGATATIPISVTIQPGSTLAGMQFRAILAAGGGAPAPAQIQFAPALGIPNPTLFGGLSPSEIVCVWPLPLSAQNGSLSLQGSNLIGSISFTVPATAVSGQSYTLHFVGDDGAPNITTQYQLEGVPGTAWVGPALAPPQITSDEWRMRFFGSLTNAEAQDNADPDGDGSPNWQEYLAGTDPTNPASCLLFNGAALAAGSSKNVSLGWLTAPGKNYVLESSPALARLNWTPVNTNSGDGNQFQISITNSNPAGSARLYRIRLQP
jgi:sugar lactone lactonase YvrE